MSLLNLTALLKAAAYLIPLALLLRGHKWRWLIVALVVYTGVNLATALTVSRQATQLVSLVAQIAITLHVFDITRYDKPPRR